MKNNKGFTLVELLAVIVVLGVILVIATTNVMQSINDSKKKAKYIAAKEIVEIASAYMYENSSSSVSVDDLISAGYLESDVTNPDSGENYTGNPGDSFLSAKVCEGSFAEQNGYDKTIGNCYKFDGYAYDIDGDCNCD